MFLEGINIFQTGGFQIQLFPGKNYFNPDAQHQPCTIGICNKARKKVIVQLILIGTFTHGGVNNDNMSEPHY